MNSPIKPTVIASERASAEPPRSNGFVSSWTVIPFDYVAMLLVVWGVFGAVAWGSLLVSSRWKSGSWEMGVMVLAFAAITLTGGQGRRFRMVRLFTLASWFVIILLLTGLWNLASAPEWLVRGPFSPVVVQGLLLLIFLVDSADVIRGRTTRRSFLPQPRRSL